MNSINGILATCNVFGTFEVLGLMVNRDLWETMVLEPVNSSSSFLQKQVTLHFNENEVVILNERVSSTEKNIFQATIIDINWGRLFGIVKLAYGSLFISALVNVKNFEAMNLNINQMCWFMVRSSAIIVEKHA